MRPALASSRSVDLPDRVEHEPGEELGVEIRALGGHGFEVGCDAFDVVHPRGGDEAGQVAAAGCDVGLDLADRVDVAERGGTVLCQSFAEHQDVQHAHAQAAPIRTMFWRQPIHGEVGSKPPEQPTAVSHGSKGKQVLVGGLLDRSPGVPAAGFASTGRLDLEFGLEPRRELAGRSAQETPRPAGESAE